VCWSELPPCSKCMRSCQHSRKCTHRSSLELQRGYVQKAARGSVYGYMLLYVPIAVQRCMAHALSLCRHP
jgi:hypothetical protein